MKRTSFLTSMRGRLSRRASSILLAAAFLLSAGGDLVGQSACPHHDPGEPQTATPGPTAHGAAAHQKAADAGAYEHGQAASSDETSEAAGHHTGKPGVHKTHTHGAGSSGTHDVPCTCIGACHVTAAAEYAPAVQIKTAAEVTLSVEAALRPSDEVAVSRILLRLLPFANGPPHLA